MAKLKVSELFNSIQGEGRYTGVPSLFLRTFGCNFRCPGFGRDHAEASTPNQEVHELIQRIPMFKALNSTFNDLPLAQTGCDTYAAVYPEFKDFSPMYSIAELVPKMKELLPHKNFHKEQHLVITGGEPLLPGWQNAYVELIDELHKQDAVVRNEFYITFETNGTQKLNEAAIGYVSANSNLHFSVSTKMMASGESREDAIKPEIVLDYMRFGKVDFKFVVDSKDGVDEIVDLLHNEFKYIWRSPHFGSVYLMPVGGTNESYEMNQAKVAELAIKYGMRFSPRLQCSVFGNQWGT